MINKIINYAGNKSKFLDSIIPLIQTAKLQGCTTYVEPFLGSGVTFLNLNETFDNYYLNDLNPSLVSILKAVSKTDYNTLLDFYNRIELKYGSLRNKDSYYNFRNDYNKYFYNQIDNVKHGLGLILLINSCINNLARFSKNGFNQSFGDRDYTFNGILKNDIGKEMWTYCNLICSNNNIVYSSLDYKKLFEDYNLDREDVVMFLDPPYFDRPSYCYGQEFTKTEFDKFISFLKTTKAKIVYTDVYHNELDNFDYTAIPLRVINSSSPSFKGKNEDKIVEYLYTNIK